MSETENGYACSLDAAALAERLDAWRVAKGALVDQRREGRRLTLLYAAEPGMREQLARLVEAEGRCCSFLRFEIHHEAQLLRLVLEAPEGAEDVLEGIAAAG